MFGPIVFETTRLYLLPLSTAQMELYLNGDSLEKQLGLEPIPREISAELHDALENTLIPGNYSYTNTLWTAIDKKRNYMVCDLSIIPIIDTVEEVEIGYGTYPAFQNQGYMTEMIGGILNWLESEQRISSVIATTAQDNIASHRVLLKNRFYTADSADELLFWRRLL